jgi:chitin synthase
MHTHSQNARSREAVIDLSLVEDIDKKLVTDILQSKFLIYNNYTNVGPCNIIAVNPFKHLAQNDAQTSEEYATSYKSDSTENLGSIQLNPHIFQLANRAFFHMRRTGNDQAIFLW